MTAIVSELFAQGRVVREPPGQGAGYWAGAPGVYYAADEKAFYLTYRLRRPRGVAPDRGGEARIARSTDLVEFQDLWSVHKDQLNTASMERCFVRKGPDGQWRYFTSFVDPNDGRWCVGVISGGTVQGLDPNHLKRLFSADALGLEGVKDPWVLEANGVFHMVLSVAITTRETRKESHSTLDIFNTGECRSATGLATSPDLENWDWRGVVFSPEPEGWDRYCRRINSVIHKQGKYFAFYDGSASHTGNYEEKTGVAVSEDLNSWSTISSSGPNLTSPHASGSLRYLDAQIVGEDLLLFYEFARPDGSHDLRMLRTKEGSVPFERSGA